VQIDTRFPLNQLNELARMESYNKHYYRPPNYLHKWWARRLGSVFRTIILGTFLEGDQDVWEAYYRRVDFGDKIVLDPFMGGGTTVVEALRLGCKIVGVDLNPVAWWTERKPSNLSAWTLWTERFDKLNKRSLRGFSNSTKPDALIVSVKRMCCTSSGSKRLLASLAARKRGFTPPT